MVDRMHDFCWSFRATIPVVLKTAKRTFAIAIITIRLVVIFKIFYNNNCRILSQLILGDEMIQQKKMSFVHKAYYRQVQF